MIFCVSTGLSNFCKDTDNVWHQDIGLAHAIVTNDTVNPGDKIQLCLSEIFEIYQIEVLQMHLTGIYDQI
jgi:hypothetical protein